MEAWPGAVWFSEDTAARYLTRRASGYPGPGARPADGRTWYLGLGLTL